MTMSFASVLSSCRWITIPEVFCVKINTDLREGASDGDGVVVEVAVTENIVDISNILS